MSSVTKFFTHPFPEISFMFTVLFVFAGLCANDEPMYKIQSRIRRGRFILVSYLLEGYYCVFAEGLMSKYLIDLKML